MPDLLQVLFGVRVSDVVPERESLAEALGATQTHTAKGSKPIDKKRSCCNHLGSNHLQANHHLNILCCIGKKTDSAQELKMGRLCCWMQMHGGAMVAQKQT